MEIKTKLKEIVGGERLFDAPEILESYSKDFSMTPPGKPVCVVQAKGTQEVREIIKFANEKRLPVVPSSSGVHFYGTTIPKQGGIVLDLSQMDRVLEIDEPNRKAKIEPGITWEKLQAELKKDGYMAMMPLLPHSSRSVVTDYLEREIPVIPVFEFSEPLLSMEVVWPNGDIFRVGSASAPNYPDSLSQGANPMGPGSLDFWRFLQGAQGTMGVVTWANIKIENRPQENKAFFIPFERIEDAIEPLFRIQRLKLGYECLLLNRFNLAMILARDLPVDFERLIDKLPPWVLILVLAGGYRRPMEKIEYEEKALNEVAKEFSGLSILSSLPGVPGLERRLSDMLREPWPGRVTYWKHQWKGGCESLFFITTLDKAPRFMEAINGVVGKYGYSSTELGCYLQPIETARACHLEFNFFYDPGVPRDRDKIKKLYREAAQALLEAGALFTRPYGILSDMVYERSASYTSTLKVVKGILDPNNIMCPSNLCF